MELEKDDLDEVFEEMTAIPLNYVKGIKREKKANGRPPKPRVDPDMSLTDALAVMIKYIGPERLAMSLIERALKGDTRALLYIYDRLDGKPHQHQIIEEVGEHPMVALFREMQDDTKALEGRRTSKYLEAGES